MKRSRLVPLAMLIPALVIPASAQKREDILSIQRDVAQLQDQVKQLQTAQDQKLAAIESMLKQALDETAKLSAAIAAMQQNVNSRLNEQQNKVEAPIAVLGTKVDQSSEDLRSIRENVADLTMRVSNLDSKLADISTAVRTLSAPAAPPPPPGAAVPQAGVPTPPPGVSAESLWQNAIRDNSAGKGELAMQEFADYIKYFPQTENAAAAQYYIGQLYQRNGQYDDAVQAFDAVLERYPDNPKTPDALYGKAYALEKAGRRTDAVAAFKEFLARFPAHSLARNAREQLRELGSSTTPASSRNKKR
jgi:tol-pal system protein YbgF